jgi:membrane-associated protease RseP (regulator of RpoE activity)
VEIEHSEDVLLIRKLRNIVEEGFLVQGFKAKDKTVHFDVTPRYSHEESFSRVMEGLKDMEYDPYYRRRGEGYRVVITPKIRKKRELKPWMHIGLIIATAFTMTLAGYIFWASGDISLSILFALSLMSILGLHELGHALMARRRGIKATLPFFIPVPPPFPFGTFGAVISINSPIPDRKSLLEVGATGPIAGFIITLPIAIIGLKFSEVAPITDPQAGGLLFSMPLILQLLADLILGEIPANHIIIPHPLAMAGWAGLFVTSLNLLPMGQLDGGHIIRSLFPRNFKKVYYGVAGFLLLMGFLWPGYILWVVLTFFITKMDHPGPLNDVSELDGRRKLYALAALLVLILTFMPAPIAPSELANH